MIVANQIVNISLVCRLQSILYTFTELYMNMHWCRFPIQKWKIFIKFKKYYFLTQVFIATSPLKSKEMLFWQVSLKKLVRIFLDNHFLFLYSFIFWICSSLTFSIWFRMYELSSQLFISIKIRDTHTHTTIHTARTNMQTCEKEFESL